MDAIKRICQGNPELYSLVAQAESLLLHYYGNMSAWDFRELRETIGIFLEDRRIKVSLFLQDESQNYDGSIKVLCGGSSYVGGFDGTGQPGTLGFSTANSPSGVEVGGVCYLADGLR